MKFITAEPKPEDDRLFTVKESDQKHTVDELMAESKLTSSYYFMLLFSAVIVVSGILLNHTTIILAGMLVAPIIKPILTLSLGIVTLNGKLIVRSLLIVILSLLIIIFVGIVLTIIYWTPVEQGIINKIISFNILYGLIAVFSGMAAALAWTKKNMLEMLTGVAIAIALIPSLALIGISVAYPDFSLIKKSLTVFSYNFIYVLLGSIFVFLLSRFGTKKGVKKEIDKQLKKEIAESNHNKKEK